MTNLTEHIALELETIWLAHQAAGLNGFMCLYTPVSQVPLRNKEPGIRFWFGPDEVKAAADFAVLHFNNGHLPNSSLLLNPVVHVKNNENDYTPIGSGILWCTALSLGIDMLKEESAERLWHIGAFASPFHRGANNRAGLKALVFCESAQSLEDNGAIHGCRELYDLADIASDQYADYYMLSGISYLTNNGLFQHPDFTELFPSQSLADKATRETMVKNNAISVQNVIDAAYCWNAYERHHALYQKFGPDPTAVESNMRYFNLVARDPELFDATGPMRKEADEMFEFIVPGLIPRGSVTMLAGAGGSGKSSLAHQLCVMAATDYEPGEEAPRWLGQRLAIEKCKGVCIYFAGEDGPPIINARAAIFDPRGRARRLMFQRTNFGEGVSFFQHLKRLYKVPDIPLMVIDPDRKYLTGDEDNSTAASEFFEALEEFAITKGTAIIIVHHLEKGAEPKSVREVLDCLRGSQVFVDRPRVVIGMFRDGPYTIAGLAKNNIPPNLGMVAEERVFARDAKHLQLVWLPGHEGVRNANLSAEEIEKLAQEARKEGR